MVTHLHYRAQLVLVGTLALYSTNSALGQAQERQLSQDANLIVEGRVENIFQAQNIENEYLVQILVQRSEAPRLNEALGNTTFPAPGQFVYAHVSLPTSLGGRAARTAATMVPEREASIRAYLRTGRQRRWEAQAPMWFESIRELQQRGTTAGGTPANEIDSLGIVAEPTTAGLKRALKVVKVTPGSPAANAGIEIGDILIKANSVALATPEQLAREFAKNSGDFAITVRDVRSGRDVLVPIPVPASADEPRMTTRPGGVRAKKELGVTTELAFYSGKAAVKVTKVEAGGTAETRGNRTGTTDPVGQRHCHHRPRETAGGRTNRPRSSRVKNL